MFGRFDWGDGMIARRMKGRSDHDKTFGVQLDSLIDIVNYGAAPAILLLSYGKYDPLFLIGAFVMLATSAIRLSYFNTFGLSGGSKYTGLALDSNNIILVFIFLFEGFYSTGTFSIILYICGLILAALNVSQIKTPKLNGSPINVYLLAIYTLAITAIYGWKLL
jgi:CDP-diacylglycerol--serine O-phosphatidyltransferase